MNTFAVAEDARTLMEGRVAAAPDRGLYRIHGPSGSCLARRAASCLLEAREGDQVLVARMENGRAFILAVLEQATAGQVISVDGPLVLRARHGAMNLDAAGDMALRSRHLDVVAASGDFKVGSMKVLGERLEARIRKARLAFQKVDEVVHRFTQRLGESFRFITGREETHAGASRTLVEGTLELQAARTCLTAEERVSVRSEHVEIV
jgi:hypothetical protein